MQTFFIQVTLADKFEDLYVEAPTAKAAIKRAKAKVARDEALKVFRNKFTDYIV